MTSYCPVPGVGPTTPADNDYQGGFAAALMLKDLRLALEAAELGGASVPMGRRARDMYENLVASSEGSRDFSAVSRAFGQAKLKQVEASATGFGGR